MQLIFNTSYFFTTKSSQSRQRGSLDSQALPDLLGKINRGTDHSIASSTTSSGKQIHHDVVHIEDYDATMQQQKVHKPEFSAPPDKDGPSYSVTVPNDFMSSNKSIWPEAQKLLFPRDEDRLRDRPIMWLMSDGMEMIFQV